MNNKINEKKKFFRKFGINIIALILVITAISPLYIHTEAKSTASILPTDEYDDAKIDLASGSLVYIHDLNDFEGENNIVGSDGTNFVQTTSTDNGVDKECQLYGYDYGIAKYQCGSTTPNEMGSGYSGYTLGVIWNECVSAIWTSNPAVCGVLSKEATSVFDNDGGTSGTVTKHEKNDISHITFCGCDSISGIEVKKKVRCGSDWVDSVIAIVGYDLTFRITVTNTGDVALSDVRVEDDLPVFLSYNSGTAIPAPSSSSDHHIEWNLGTLNAGDTETITFTASVIDTGDDYNSATGYGYYNDDDNTPLHRLKNVLFKKFKFLEIILDPMIYLLETSEESDTDIAHVVAKPPPDIEIVKKVHDGASWVDSISAAVSTDLTFRITVTNTGDVVLSNVLVVDDLPVFLSYNSGTAIPDPSSSSDYHIEWVFVSIPVSGSEVIEFTAHVDAAGSGDNVAGVTSDVACDMGVSDEDSVHVVSEEAPEPGIDVEKYVWDEISSSWKTEIRVPVGTDLLFRIIVTNTGSTDLTDVSVVDGLTIQLEYRNLANITPDFESPRKIIWNFSLLTIGEQKEITYHVETVNVCYGTNLVTVTASEPVYDDAIVKVKVNESGQAVVDVTMQVWDDISSQWVDSITRDIGSNLPFRIIVNNTALQTVHNFVIADHFPPQLLFLNDSSYLPSSVSSDTVIWHIDEMSPEEVMEITYHAETILTGVGDTIVNVTTDEQYEDEDSVLIEVLNAAPETDAHGPYEGIAGIPISFKGSVSSGTPPYTWFWSFGDKMNSLVQNPSHSYDVPGNYTVSLSVTDDIDRWDTDQTYVVIYSAEDFIVDAGGPYSGDIGEAIQFYGNAIGGTQPYSWHWEFGDGVTSTSQNPTHTFTVSGVYTATLTVTDNYGKTDDDTAQVSIGSHAPSKPTINGPTSGKAGTVYTYTSSTSDPDGDQIFYLFDWDDGTDSGWIGPYTSGEEISESHQWTSKGDYEIKVKAKDTNDVESPWSDPLSVSMPRNKPYINIPFIQFLQNFLENHPILYRLLQRVLRP